MFNYKPLRESLKDMKEAIKNSNGETVKLREVCPKCESALVAYDYDNKWFCYNCLNKWTRE